jgi:hypothetical protein
MPNPTPNQAPQTIQFDKPFTPAQAAPQSEPPVTADGGPLGQAALGALKSAADAHTPQTIQFDTPFVPSSPIQDKSTIGPQPKPTVLGTLENIAQIPVNPIGEATKALDAITGEITNYTPAGRAEHPILARVGDALQATRELLTGGQSAGKPMGTKYGVLNNPVTVAMSAAPGAAEAAPQAIAKVNDAIDAVRATRAAKKAEEAEEIAAQTKAINPEQFIYREEPPQPQHGTPVKTAQPLDNATINALPGGRELSPEGVEALKAHVGGQPGAEIEVGSTPKNTILKAVAPVQKTLADTGTAMNKVIADAAPFRTSVVEDGGLDSTINDIRQNLPGGAEGKLNLAIDKEVENAYPALDSKDPSEVLAYRRQLGSQIDWNNLVKNPDTPSEAQNLTRAKIYRLLGDKIHTEIPDTIPLDKVFQPNLELQSYLDSRFGQAISRDPAAADAQQLSELKKGKAQIETKAYNAIVKRNRELAGLPTTDVAATVEPAERTPIDAALNKAVDKIGVPANEQPALEQLLKSSIQQRRMPVVGTKLPGIKTNWLGALNEFDKLNPAERAARFSDPLAVRSAISKQATKQALWAIGRYGGLGIVSYMFGVPQSILHALLGE